jgi:hypothetical protein
MDFQKALSQLQDTCRRLHDLSNLLAEAVHNQQEAESQSLKAQFEVLHAEEQQQRLALQNNFPEPYRQFVLTRSKQLTALQQHLQKLPPEKAEFKHQFNLSLCKSVLADYTKFANGKKTKYEHYWLSDVADSLIEEYKTILA